MASNIPRGTVTTRGADIKTLTDALDPKSSDAFGSYVFSNRRRFTQPGDADL